MSIFSPENYRSRIAENDQYKGLLTGDLAGVAPHTILDLSYARLYANNLLQHLLGVGINLNGPIVDIGGGSVAIASAFSDLIEEEVWGIDLPPPQ